MAEWEAPPPGTSPAAAGACWPWNVSTSRIVWARATASPASSASPTTKARSTSRSYAAPTRIGAKPSDCRVDSSYSSVDAGPPSSQVVRGSLASCIEHNLAHESLTATELQQRFPAFALPSDYEAVFQPEGGFLASEQAIVTHTELAQAQGADIRAREKVLGFEPTSGGVRVTTERGKYEACQLVVAAGAWIRDFVPELAHCAEPERQVLGWFQPKTPALFHPDRFPVFNLAAKSDRYYGMPIWGMPGFKFGRYHHLHETVDPDSDFREPHSRDEETLRAGVGRFFPDANGPVLGLATCLFTNTPDEHFIIDTLPHLPAVVASPCSGHGFKFSSVVGEILADLALTGATSFDLTLFRLARFGTPSKESQA